MGGEQRGVILYGYEVDAVAEALRALDPRYVPAGQLEPGQVPVLCRADAAEADAARDAAPDVAWLVVTLYGERIEHARDPVLYLNASKVDPGMAARAIDQHDLVTWFELINPIWSTTTDGLEVAEDYSNLRFVVPDGHRIIAHAVTVGAPTLDCPTAEGSKVLPSHDLWALGRVATVESCPACTSRHG